MHIDSYEFGRLVVDGRTFTQDLILLPDQIQASWWRQQGHLLQLADIPEVLQAKPEVLIVGQGQPGRMQVDPEVTRSLQSLGIELVVVPTAEACRLFNSLAGRRRVAAALHLTC
ncbi:MAG: Mth938-like domain-containing protein [Desulfobacca sp.]|uniref:Mth938-like domain-containing protein n=1 Tax=Desulfobacca sp. TaxID=2067990 RepID=UPI0040497447